VASPNTLGRDVLGKLTLTLLSLSCLLYGAANHAAAGGPEPQDVDGPPVTRSQAVLTADEYARVCWVMAEANRTGVDCAGNFTSTYPVGPRIGMGYKFGGWDSMDEFLSEIAKGYGTGTAAPETYEAYPFDCVTGISCTGLVSRAWHLEHKYTLDYPEHPDVPRQMHEITQPLETVDFLKHKTGELKKGDAFLNPSHVMLFIYETRDGSPMIIHSSTGGVRFEKSSWYYLWSKGYRPLRYNGIRDDENPQGTVSNPIVIDSDSLPYTHRGNTRDVVSMEFDRYSTALGINQPGPEAVYELRLESPTALSINVTDFKDEGIDNDVHVLSTLKRGAAREALDCLVRGDREVTTQLDAGTYYIVVDSGVDLPGEYTLRVSLHSSPGFVAKRRRGPWVQGLRPRPPEAYPR
jgi:hypothetical protein